jgi:hypothetical protein
MTREELIKKVAMKMDEISSSNDVFVSVGADDNNPLYTQINSLLNESINDVLSKAPVYRLTSFVSVVPKDDIRADNVDGGRQVAVARVPSNFIRIVSITDTLLKRPIVELAYEGDEVDKRQHNRFLMAGNAKPVAVFAQDVLGQGEKAITCYSYAAGDTPNPAIHYIKRFEGSLDTSSSIDIDDYLADIVTWVCAGKVFVAEGFADRGKICDENAAAIMI